MATTDRSKQANFGLLPEEKKSFGSFGVSLIVNILIAAIAVLLTVSQVHERMHQMQSTELIFPVPQPKPYIPPPPRVHIPPPPPPPVTRTQPSRIIPPRPVKVQAPPKPVHINTPRVALPRFRPAPPLRVAPPPRPRVGLFRSATPTRVANNRERPTMHTGGFGDPEGVHPNPSATRQPDIAAVGAFNGTPGLGKPSPGAARQGSVHGVNFGSGVTNGVPGGRDRGTVASTGFGSGVIGGTGRPGGRGRVAEPSFGGNMYGGGGTHPAVQQARTTPIIVLWKPLPQYTAEARAEHIQGDVTLRVRFTAGGQVDVLGVVHGLGAGLDQQAIAAAEKIRFKPATRDGQAVDQVSIIRISFQMT